MMATLTILEGDLKKGKHELRNCLKLNLDPKKQAQILNNLAYASWKHLNQLEKIKGRMKEVSEELE